MLNIKNKELLGDVMDEAIKTANTHSPSEAVRERWVAAIIKAGTLLASGELPHIQFDRKTGTALFAAPGKLYVSNGTCQCQAYSIDHRPCYHRALARLVTRYYEQESANV